jgi:FdhE protein
MLDCDWSSDVCSSDLRKALEDKRLEARAALGAILSGDAEALDLLALGANLPRPSLEFMLRELVKPLLERRAQALGRLLADQAWELGSCPICGSLPELAFLKGDGGQRWLRCSACAHHWRFKRITCPVCGNEEPDQTGYLYAEGAERERVEVCRQCNKYLVALDIRGLDREPLWQVAALGLVHLDLLAQREGLTPAANCAWNNLG